MSWFYRLKYFILGLFKSSEPVKPTEAPEPVKDPSDHPWLDVAIDELLQHQQAVISAMRSALGDYLGYFEPESLDRHFKTQKKRGSAGKKPFRELYKNAFEGLAQPNKNKLPQRFDDEFAKAYELETTE